MLLFFGCLEFVSKSNIPLSVGLSGLDVFPPRHPRYILFPSLGILSRVPTALHFPVAHIDNITGPISIFNDTYNFVYIHIIFGRNLQLIIK